MKKILITLLFISNLSLADTKLVNFTLQFGTTSLNVDGERTEGFGLSAATEIYFTNVYGWNLIYGNATTTADDIEIDGKEATDVSITNQSLRVGPFYSPLKGLRVGGLDRKGRFEIRLNNHDTGKIGGLFQLWPLWIDSSSFNFLVS